MHGKRKRVAPVSTRQPRPLVRSQDLRAAPWLCWMSPRHKCHKTLFSLIRLIISRTPQKIGQPHGSVARYIIRGASSGLVPRCDRPSRTILFLCGNVWHLKNEGASAPYVSERAGLKDRTCPEEPQLRQSPQPTQFKQLTCMNPGHRAEFIEWQEAIGYEQ
jgi:hypothetical protein